MKKKKNVVIFGVFLVVVIVPLMFCLSRDKISIVVDVKLNGKSIEIDNVKTNCVYEDAENCEYTYSNGTFEIKNVKSGGYELTLVIPKENLEDCKEDLIIKFDYIQPGKNKTSESRCELDIKTSNMGLYGSYNINLERNKGSEQYTGNIEVHNNTIELYWGI